MAAAGSLSVVGVDGSSVDGCDCVFHVAGLVESIGMESHLHVIFVGTFHDASQSSRGGAPVLMNLEAASSGLGLFCKVLPD